jgi:hypothetical protein
MNHSKIIFLDFDGVLNNPGCYEIASGSHTPPDQSCVDALNRIISETGASIVVSSSWRRNVALRTTRTPRSAAVLDWQIPESETLL